MIKEMGMEDQCVITSVSLDYLKRVKEAEPELKTGYILAAAYGSYYKNEFVDFISIRSSLVTEKQIQAAHEYGEDGPDGRRQYYHRLSYKGKRSAVPAGCSEKFTDIYQAGDEIGGRYSESSTAESD